tara:strand:- start:174 stop:476 length:303 start_codon:yes stop_codon:yes gene_type:complete
LDIKNQRLARDILYDHSHDNMEIEQREDQIPQRGRSHDDMRDSYEFDMDCAELGDDEAPVELKDRSLKSKKARNFMMNHQVRREEEKENKNQSNSSLSKS